MKLWKLAKGYKVPAFPPDLNLRCRNPPFHGQPPQIRYKAKSRVEIAFALRLNLVSFFITAIEIKRINRLIMLLILFFSII